MSKFEEKLAYLEERVKAVEAKLDLPARQKQVEIWETAAAAPGFWSDPIEAQKVMRALGAQKKIIGMAVGPRTDLSDLKVLWDLWQEEGRGNLEVEEELAVRIGSLEKTVAKVELSTFLSGSYDDLDVVFSIHAGQGGVEAMDWAEMLLRMYTRYFESQGWEWDLVDETRGEEAGVKSVTLTVKGPYAYGYLRREKGTHRLVRQSPFNADHLRQTSFALVEVLPIVEDREEIEIKNEDVEFEAFRSGGPGGQNVNKVSTAVRLRHKPSNIVVTSQSERYQHRNREIAIQLLRAKLWEVKERERKAEFKKISGEHRQASWGNQIRSYVLHPYKMVKDHRSGVEVANAELVLDGQLEPFIEAELRGREDSK